MKRATAIALVCGQAWLPSSPAWLIAVARPHSRLARPWMPRFCLHAAASDDGAADALDVAAARNRLASGWAAYDDAARPAPDARSGAWHSCSTAHAHLTALRAAHP